MVKGRVKQDGNDIQNEHKDNYLDYFLFQSQYPLLFTTLKEDPK